MTFKGKKAKSGSFLFKYEKAVADYLVPKVPEIFDTKVLTLMTFLWGALVILFYYLSRGDIRYLWAISGVILIQWLTDILDGGVGRYRNQGLIKWGFYMDHFLDYYFMCCFIIGLFLFLGNGLYTIMALSILGMFFMSTFLKFGALSIFDTSFMSFSPAEMRLLAIGTNLALTYLSRNWFNKLFLGFLIIAGLLLIYNIYKNQESIYCEDMKNIKK